MPQRKGGAPKINFAYTYALVDTAPIGYTKLNPTEKLIIALKYDDVSEVAENNDLWQNAAFMSRALGHVLVRETRVGDHPMLVLSDFTVHRSQKSMSSRSRSRTMSITSAMSLIDSRITGGSRSRSRSRSRSSGGYSAVLVGIALACIEITYTTHLPNLVLWAAVTDPGWISVLVNTGFNTPYIASSTPDGIVLAQPSLALSKHIIYFANNVSLVRDSLIKALDMWKNNGAPACKTTFTLDEQAILRLRLMPYLGTTGIKGIRDRADQREMAGSLVMSGSDSMSLETILENGGIKFTMGDNAQVMTPIHEFFSFHTHPIGLYVDNGVMVGTPSGQDVQTFVNGALYGTSKAHFVVAIEGLYCLSLSDAAAASRSRVAAEMQSRLVDIMNAFEYPFSLRAFNWAAYGQGDLNKREVAGLVSNYLEWFQTTSANFGGLIVVRFVPWAKLTASTKWAVWSAPIQSSCFVDKRDLSQALAWGIDDRDI